MNDGGETILEACLMGMAVGDALGLPYEGIGPRRAARLLGPPERHRLLFGQGMVSDDTEHALLTARALRESGEDPEAFSRGLGRGLRRWIAALPAGVGLATLRAGIKLCLGWPPTRSGVFSAGNGPAMRAPVIGVWCMLHGFGDDRLREFVRRATILTHTDPMALAGALAIALAARQFTEAALADGLGADSSPVDSGPGNTAAGPAPDDDTRRFRERLSAVLAAGEDIPESTAAALLDVIGEALDHAAGQGDTPDFVQKMGWTRGVSGYMPHTVAAVLHAVFRHGADFQAAVTALICGGGDADTTAAIGGALAGIRSGRMEAIPEAWRRGLSLWPESATAIAALARDLAGHPMTSGRSSPAPFFPAALIRNLAFIPVVLVHGFRRLFPPY